MYVSIEETDRVSKMKTRRDRKREKCSKERERLRVLEREREPAKLSFCFNDLQKPKKFQIKWMSVAC